MPKLHERLFQKIKNFPSAMEKIENYIDALWEKMRKDPSYTQKIKSSISEEKIRRLSAGGIFRALCIKLGLREKILERQYKIVEKEYKKCGISEDKIPFYILTSFPLNYGPRRFVFNPEVDEKRKFFLELVKSSYKDLYRELKFLYTLYELSATDERIEDSLEERIYEVIATQRNYVQNFLKRLGAKPEILEEVMKDRN